MSRPTQELAFTQDEPAELKRARTMHITFDRGCPETPTECGLRFRLVEDYACWNGFPNPIHFTDDGISGTRFDCPGFTAMMEGVEAGNADAIIVKDDCVIVELNSEGS